MLQMQDQNSCKGLCFCCTGITSDWDIAADEASEMEQDSEDEAQAVDALMQSAT